MKPKSSQMVSRLKESLRISQAHKWPLASIKTRDLEVVLAQLCPAENDDKAREEPAP